MKAGPDFGEVEGIIESMVPFQDPVVWAHHAGWFYPDGKDGKRGYFYGAGVSPDYDGPIPAGFASREIPGSYYLVFGHPKYDLRRQRRGHETGGRPGLEL